MSWAAFTFSLSQCLREALTVPMFKRTIWNWNLLGEKVFNDCLESFSTDISIHVFSFFLYQVWHLHISRSLSLSSCVSNLYAYLKYFILLKNLFCFCIIPLLVGILFIGITHFFPFDSIGQSLFY